MNKILKTYIQNDLDALSNKNLGIIERRKIKANIDKFLNLSNEIDKLFDSDLELSDLLNKHNKKKKDDLKEFLYNISPYDFEVLIAKLFNAMGYNTEITKKSNDLGVDIIATGIVGLTPIKEVVQVKRQKSNIHRPVLDRLRGVIPLHNATTGTIITLGQFSEGCHKLTPKNIKLIDGDKLIDYLFEYKIGFNVETIEIHKVDYNFFKELPR